MWPKTRPNRRIVHPVAADAADSAGDGGARGVRLAGASPAPVTRDQRRRRAGTGASGTWRRPSTRARARARAVSRNGHWWSIQNRAARSGGLDGRDEECARRLFALVLVGPQAAGEPSAQCAGSSASRSSSAVAKGVLVLDRDVLSQLPPFGRPAVELGAQRGDPGRTEAAGWSRKSTRSLQGRFRTRAMVRNQP